MSKDRRPLYGWDTSVFVAWLNEEQSAPLGDIALVANEIDKDDAVLVVSVTVVSEVLECKMTDEQRTRFNKFFQRSNVILADVTLPIAQKAREIRDRGNAEGRKIKTPDAQIIATAIVFRCHVLHSLDNRGNGALRLDGSTIVDGLKITPPRPLSGQRGIT